MAQRWSPSRPPGARLSARHARELARIPAFRELSPRELRRLARWGDLVEVDAGHVLARRDHSDWWLFVVLSGRISLDDGTPATEELGPGSHFGETAIVGLRPHQATATALERSRLFVLGPRYVISLLGSSPRFRRAIFPAVSGREYASFARRMYDVGQDEWRSLAAAHRQVPATTPTATVNAPAVAPAPGRDRPPGRSLTLAEAVQALGQLPPPPPKSTPVQWRMSRTTRWGIAITAGAALAAVLLLYHPPMLVLSAGRPIDVTADIEVAGAPSFATHTHYLLLWVNARQPPLAGLLLAWAQRRTVVGDDENLDDRRTGRADYLTSQRRAITAAVRDAGMDPTRVVVHIRDRGFRGPSAGVIYALALRDLLTSGDLSPRTAVAATGGLAPDGHVTGVGWLALKLRALHSHGVFVIVPAEQAGQARGYAGEVCGVTTIADAIAAVRDPGTSPRCHTAAAG